MPIVKSPDWADIRRSIGYDWIIASAFWMINYNYSNDNLTNVPGALSLTDKSYEII